MWKSWRQKLVSEFVYWRYKNELGNILSLKKFSYKSYYSILVNTIHAFDEAMRKNGNFSFDMPLEFVISDSMDINAWAFNMYNIDFIVLNQGAFLNVYEYFFTLMADKDAFIEFGDASLGAIGSERAFPTADYKKGQLLFHYGPKDQLRQDLAFSLAYISTLYIALHELGHHYNGHILLQNSLMPSCHLNRMYYKADSTIDQNMFSQTIEMDADAFAATNSLRILMQSTRGEHKLPFDELALLTDPNDLLKIWIYAINATFLILGKDGIDASNMKNYKYLPRRIRQVLNISISEKVIDQEFEYLFHRNIINRDTVEEMLLNQMVLAEMDFNRINNLTFDFKDILGQLNENVSKHTDEVRYYWNEVKPLLEPYARIPLASEVKV